MVCVPSYPCHKKDQRAYVLRSFVCRNPQPAMKSRGRFVDCMYCTKRCTCLNHWRIGDWPSSSVLAPPFFFSEFCHVVHFRPTQEIIVVCPLVRLTPISIGLSVNSHNVGSPVTSSSLAFLALRCLLKIGLLFRGKRKKLSTFTS